MRLNDVVSIFLANDVLNVVSYGLWQAIKDWIVEGKIYVSASAR